MFWRSRWRPLVRLINRCELGRAWRFRLPQIRPHSRPIGEMVHWSALARWEETKAGRRRQRYAPRNLLAAIESVQESRTPVVGLDGEPTSLAGLYTGNGAAEPPGAVLRRRRGRPRPMVRGAIGAARDTRGGGVRSLRERAAARTRLGGTPARTRPPRGSGRA